MKVRALHAYAAARELHETRANHLAIVERDIAAFWAEGQQDPSLPFRDADARTTRIASLMAERGAVIVVERQAYEGLVAAIERLVVALPVATVPGASRRSSTAGRHSATTSSGWMLGARRSTPPTAR